MLGRRSPAGSFSVYRRDAWNPVPTSSLSRPDQKGRSDQPSWAVTLRCVPPATTSSRSRLGSSTPFVGGLENVSNEKGISDQVMNPVCPFSVRETLFVGHVPATVQDLIFTKIHGNSPELAELFDRV